MHSELEPDRSTRALWAKRVLDHLDDFIDNLPDAPASWDGTGGPPSVVTEPAAGPRPLEQLLTEVAGAASAAVETAGPGYLAYFPAGGLYSSVLGELLAQTVNRYTGVASTAPGMVALEQSVLRWFCREFGLPQRAGGLITTGASLATLAAVHAARTARLTWTDPRAAIYVTEHTHHCVAKAARIAGFTDDQLRLVPVDAELRMDLHAARAAIERDRAGGWHPFLIVGTAGSTSTGTVDPLPGIAALAADQDLWFHVDGAYGGGFQLTAYGRSLLAGVELADSVAFDPHKSLFLPYGTGVLMVRDQETLRAAHSAHGDYLQDLVHDTGLPDFADLGAELTRDSRGLRLWLPLHLHGVDAFRAALDEKLELARWAYDELCADPLLDVPLRPDLTVIVARSVAGDDATRRLLDRVNAGRRVFLSSTRVAGRYALRLCVLSHRTHRDRVEEGVAAIRAAVRQI
ncbi:pyridoxal phosphate-dependent decarboxylase family protein [Jiangella rhizosphaerae]|uniref:Aminotransferase class V-fold PLP-dependent enzyme n=1 Tax=Jiangella rhizosphaerae TaxID=2293569 RepID=A0A418KN30_9ACTN|nr:aminotransferase class V-fold PLP-dependent enzyme [Jiangella rhizosphaerae]RIQ20383.1 aminotransferase class V-fold PLP-dependent enzyme [Jiangella rhizosphaerae]